MTDYKDVWDKKHRDYFTGKIIYDDWLNRYLDIINKSKKPIIDLGCGQGNNSLYLIERGKEVIACDYSSEALKIVNKYLPSVPSYQFDMRDGFPFDGNCTDLVIADLSLHYFSYEETRKILNELKRVIVNNGYLLFRVNSINDINHGSVEGNEIENHYYEIEGIQKRFFDQVDIEVFFKDWEIIELREVVMTRYEKVKVPWEGLVKNIK
ncbi:MAG: class I SAM-dependent methyltransferase [Bacilli bacterium]|nr:class I SAM-dependent methyltransferase [Bacilli bacterium]MDD4808515.1 class I SAM-dependent methyltransferase [Bacilli bacterium]